MGHIAPGLAPLTDELISKISDSEKQEKKNIYERHGREFGEAYCRRLEHFSPNHLEEKAKESSSKVK
jgi:hypothetical protein